MFYCETCRRLQEEAVDKCPHCRSKGLRAPQDGDFVLLTSQESIWAGMLQDLFTQNGIAFTTQGERGAALALKTGPAFERFRFFVPYGQLAQAQELMAAFMDGGKTEG